MLLIRGSRLGGLGSSRRCGAVQNSTGVKQHEALPFVYESLPLVSRWHVCQEKNRTSSWSGLHYSHRASSFCFAKPVSGKAPPVAFLDEGFGRRLGRR